MVRIAQGSKIVVSIMLISIILGSLESIRFALGRDIFTYGMDIFAVSPYLTEEMNLEQLTWEDARAIADIPGVRSVDSIKISRAEVLIYDTQTNMNITYTTPDFIDISGRKITDGRNFRGTDFSKSYRVVILPENTRDLLYSKDVNPLGSRLYINGEDFTVIGTLSQSFIEKIVNRFKVLRDYLPMISQLVDLIYPKRELIVPLYYNPYDKLDAIIITVDAKHSRGTMKAVLKDETVKTLRFRHLQESDYEVFNVHERLLVLKVYLGLILGILFLVSILLIISGLKKTRSMDYRDKVLFLLTSVSIGELLGIILSRVITLEIDFPPAPLWVFFIGLIIPLYTCGVYEIKKLKL